MAQPPSNKGQASKGSAPAPDEDEGVSEQLSTEIFANYDCKSIDRGMVHPGDIAEPASLRCASACWAHFSRVDLPQQLQEQPNDIHVLLAALDSQHLPYTGSVQCHSTAGERLSDLGEYWRRDCQHRQAQQASTGGSSVRLQEAPGNPELRPACWILHRRWRWCWQGPPNRRHATIPLCSALHQCSPALLRTPAPCRHHP